MLRQSAPGADGRPGPGIGLISGHASVRIVERNQPAPSERMEHWAKVDFAPDPAPRVELDFGSHGTGAASDFSGQLTALGYLPAAASRPAAPEGAAEAVYCDARDRAAASRLAAQATRWLAEGVPGMHSVVVGPRHDPACGGGGAGRLVLRIHVPRSTSAWINGRWGVGGDCALPVTIRTNGRELVSSFGDHVSTLTIDSATSSAIVAGRRRYTLGNAVTVTARACPPRMRAAGLSSEYGPSGSGSGSPRRAELAAAGQGNWR